MGVFRDTNNKRKRQRRHLNRNWMLLVGALAIFTGIFLIYFSSHLPKQLPIQYADMISSTLMPLGQVIISISITALLFERFGYVDYTVNRVCDALARDEVLNVLDAERKEELKELLFEDIYLGRQPAQDPSQLVKQINTDINTLLSDYYYEEYHTSCDISIITSQDGQRYFRKHISRIMTVRPIQMDRECKLTRLYHLSTNNISSGIKDQEGNVLSPVQFVELSIGDKTLPPETGYKLVQEKNTNDSPYSVSYRLVLTDKNLLNLSDKPLQIKLVYVTYVPNTDPIYSITVDKPCKSFSCHFSSNIPDYNLHVKSYGFMSFSNNTRKTHLKTQNGETVRFRSWILPGDGAVAVLTPKQSVPVCPIYMPQQRSLSMCPAAVQSKPKMSGVPQASSEETELTGVN